MKNWTLALGSCSLIVGLAAVTSITTASAADVVAADEAKTPINAKCPIMGGKAKSSVTTQWGDKTIGFCCPPCIKKWEALSEEAKTTKLAKVTEPVNAKCPIMGGKAKSSVVTQWNDKTVGFCCPPCIKKWNALSDEEKATKLAAAK